MIEEARNMGVSHQLTSASLGLTQMKPLESYLVSTCCWWGGLNRRVQLQLFQPPAASRIPKVRSSFKIGAIQPRHTWGTFLSVKEQRIPLRLQIGLAP
jgi:hypothetical protein